MNDRLAAWWFSVGSIVGYGVAVVVPLSMPVFHPRLGTWDLASIPGEPSMRWYGWLLAGLIGGVIGMAAGRLIRRMGSWHVVWALGALALALAVIVRERDWFTR